MSLQLFTVQKILKTDNEASLNKSATYLEAQAWNQPEGRTSGKYLENIASKFFKNCLVSKLSLRTASHSLSSTLQAFLFLLFPPSFSRVESFSEHIDYKMGHQRAMLYFYIGISHFLLSPTGK